MEPTGYPYEFLINNAQAYLHGTSAAENGGLDAFRISEVLAVLLGKTKEDVLADIVETPVENLNKYKRTVVAYLKTLKGSWCLLDEIINECGGTPTQCRRTLRDLWECGEVVCSGTASSTQYYWYRHISKKMWSISREIFNLNPQAPTLCAEEVWDLTPAADTAP